jgi:pimeloyl-ACP methyl ester carboxylesterase
MGACISPATDAAFASLAYLQKPYIQSQLQELPELSGWRLEWGPVGFGLFDSALLLSKRGADCQGVTSSALVLRSRIPNCDHLFDNLDLSMSTLPWMQPGFLEARCSTSLVRSARALMELLGGEHSTTLLNRLRLDTPCANLRVVGHSTGGALACLAALWIRNALEPLHGLSVWPRAFGAPTPGNAHFANAFKRVFPQTTHFASTMDISPLTWSAAGLEEVIELYPGASGPSALEKGLLFVARKEVLNLGYTQVPSQVMLRAKLKPGLTFQAQAKWQHQISQYLELLTPSIPASTG